MFSLLQASGGGPLDRLKLNPRMQPFIAQLTELVGSRPAGVAAVPHVAEELRHRHGVRPPERHPDHRHGAGDSRAPLLIARYVNCQEGAYILGLWALALFIALSQHHDQVQLGHLVPGAGDVWDLVFSRVGATFRLGFTALAIALIIGIPLGIYQAVRQYSFFDQLGTIGAFLAFSTPIFIIGVGLQIIFALYLEKWTGVKLFYVDRHERSVVLRDVSLGTHR